MTHAAKFLSLAAIAAVASVGMPSLSVAAVQCKATANVTMALTQNAAISAWRSQVTNAYGAAWSNFDIAKNKMFADMKLGVVVMQQVSARACRPAVMIAPNQVFQLKPQ